MVGKMRIWDTTQKEHPLKKEYQFLSGPIRDIAWSSDSQRLAVVGEGRDKFGHVFLFDTGTSNGTLTGQAKPINAVDFRPAKPMRIVTASEDYSVAIFEGPPFKFKNMFQQHTRFAQCVRYNHDGTRFASGGADGRVLLFEGLEGEMNGELTDPQCKNAAHGGGVYSLSWSPDGSRLVTTSGDKTAKLWEVSSKRLVSCFSFGHDIEDQQLSCLWQGDDILSVNLAGFIQYLDLANTAAPKRVVQGHNKPITGLSVDSRNQHIYSADMEGFVVRWNAVTGESERLTPKFHKAQIQKLITTEKFLVTVSIDDTLSLMNLPSAEKSVSPKSVKLTGQPRSVDLKQDCVAVACQKEILVFDTNLTRKAALTVPAVLTCIALNPDAKILAVGGEDNTVRVYDYGGGDSLKLVKELQHGGIITDMAFSPDGLLLAVCDAARRVVPYKVPCYELASPKEWTFHTARVNCLSWSPDSKFLATGSLDTSIIVWSLGQPGEYPLIMKCAHPMSQITGVGWLDRQTVVSAGQDANVKQWHVSA